MGTEQMPILDKETDESKMLSPSKDSETVSREPRDFLKLTPTQFGITVQSFSAAPSGRKAKSRLAQLKARRKSSVGARGSPETNSLIRFIAQQKMKNSSNCQTPEQLVRGSPFLPRVASTLKQKIACFQSLTSVEDSGVCDLMPRQDDNTGECMKTIDYLSDEYNQEEGKENHHRMVSPVVPSKKGCVGPLKGCEVQIREAHTPALHLNGSDKEGDKEPVAECNDNVKKGPLPSSESETETQTVLPSTALHGYREPPMSLENYAYSSKKNQQDNVFEPQNPSRARPSDLTSASPEESFSGLQFSSLASQTEMKSAEENESSGASAAKKEKKRVHFGCPLSPEFFDKQLPPSTPLQKGKTPARASTPGGILKLRSFFKTPQRNEFGTPQAQPDLSSAFGASPVLAMSYKHRMPHVAEDEVEMFEKIIFPSIEDSDSAIMTDTELINDAQLNLNDAFHDEALAPVVTEENSETSPAYQSNALNELESLSEEKQAETFSKAAPRLRNWEKKAVAKSESPNEFPAARRKRKLPEKSEPVRRSIRCAAKPSETIKLSSTAANQWKKEVNLSLYGSRTYASKNPSLTTIIELFINQSAAAQHSPISCSDEIADLNNEPGESSSSGFGTSDSIVESPSLSSGKRAVGTNGCSSRPRATRRRSMKASVSTDDLPRAEPQMQTKEKPSEETQVDGGLACWQGDFNFEDVFKRVPSRGQRSVRRSLRNQSKTDNDTGLAWVPRLSPEILKATGKKRRGRSFSSTVLPAGPV